MTLEQIKNRQERINEMLYALLEDTKDVVQQIAGEFPQDGLKEIENCSSLGLLGAITNSQNISEEFIKNISEYKDILVRSVYAPEEVFVEVAKYK